MKIKHLIDWLVDWLIDWRKLWFEIKVRIEIISLYFVTGNEFRKVLGQMPKQRINSVRAQDIFTQEVSSPSSPSVSISAFDYSGNRLVQRSHSSSSSAAISVQSSKSRHRSKSHGDDFVKKQVSQERYFL